MILLNAAKYNESLFNIKYNIDTINKATLMVCRQHAPATKIQFTNLTTAINTVAT